MRALILLLGCCLVVLGISLLQTGSPTFLGQTVQVFSLGIPVFAIVITGAAVGGLIAIFTFVSYEGAIKKAPPSRWFVSEIVIGALVCLLLYAPFVSTTAGKCIAFAGSEQYCLHSWLYDVLWIAGIVPLAAGFIGLVRALSAGVRNSGAIERVTSWFHRSSDSPKPVCDPEKEICPPREDTPAAGWPLGGDLRVASPPFLIAGVVLALVLLIFVNSFERVDGTCYYIGTFTLDGCHSAWLYDLAWLVAVGLAVYGVFGEQLPGVLKSLGERLVGLFKSKRG